MCDSKKVEELYHSFKDRQKIAYYHGGLSGQERRMLQQQFLSGELRILVATNAFGMGINKENIRFVIHYDLPDSPENYLQEVGRAGRDGQLSQAILLYEEGDEFIHHFLQEQTNQSKKLFEIKQKMSDLVFEDPLIKKWEQFFPNDSSHLMDLLSQRGVTKKKQLQKMLDYIATTKCRREFLVSYFDESLPEKIQFVATTMALYCKNTAYKKQQVWAKYLGKKLFKKFLKIQRKIENWHHIFKSYGIIHGDSI